MHALYPLPRIWLFSDVRNRDSLFSSVQTLPRESGIVFRDYNLPPFERAERFQRLVGLCQECGHVLLVAGTPMPGEALFAVGTHNRETSNWGIRSCAVHNMNELNRAIRLNADLVFISPVFETRSHPDQRPLGVEEALRIAKIAPMRTFALGGVTQSRFNRYLGGGFYGWAAVSAPDKNG